MKINTDEFFVFEPRFIDPTEEEDVGGHFGWIGIYLGDVEIYRTPAHYDRYDDYSEQMKIAVNTVAEKLKKLLE